MGSTNSSTIHTGAINSEKASAPDDGTYTAQSKDSTHTLTQASMALKGVFLFKRRIVEATIATSESKIPRFAVINIEKQRLSIQSLRFMCSVYHVWVIGQVFFLFWETRATHPGLSLDLISPHGPGSPALVLASRSATTTARNAERN